MLKPSAILTLVILLTVFGYGCSEEPTSPVNQLRQFSRSEISLKFTNVVVENNTSYSSGGATLVITYHSYLRWLFAQGYSYDKTENAKRVYDIKNGWLIKRIELFKRRSPGNTCISSLISGVAGSIDRPINNSKGCGGVMRVAPVGLMFYNDLEYSFEIATQESNVLDKQQIYNSNY